MQSFEVIFRFNHHILIHCRSPSINRLQKKKFHVVTIQHNGNTPKLRGTATQYLDATKLGKHNTKQFLDA